MQTLSENSTYEDFISGLDYCCELYHKKLRDEAQIFAQQFAKSFQQSMPTEIKDTFLYNLCESLCDGGDKLKLLNRSHGRLPFQLSDLLWEYLKEQCQADKMPHLLCIWKLYRYEPFAFKMLERAFNNAECDNRVVKEYFGTFLSDLDWGSHHFPECMIIEREFYDELIEKCHNVLTTRDVVLDQVDELNYYIKLYNSYFKYVEEGKVGDFEVYCLQAGIKYDIPNTYSYDEVIGKWVKKQ